MRIMKIMANKFSLRAHGDLGVFHEAITGINMYPVEISIDEMTGRKFR